MAQQSQYQWHFNKDCYPPSPLLLIVQFQPLHTPQINTFADSSLAAIDSPFGVRVAEEMILTIRRFWLGIECPIYPRSRLSAEARESLDGSWLCTVPWGLGNSTRFIADSHLHIYSPWGKLESLLQVMWFISALSIFKSTRNTWTHTSPTICRFSASCSLRPTGNWNRKLANGR